MKSISQVRRLAGNVAVVGTGLFRGLLTFVVVFSTLNLWFNSPSSLTARLGEAGGPTAEAIKWLMLLFLVMSALDQLGNDLAHTIGGRNLLPTLIYVRPLVFLGMGSCYFLLAVFCGVSGFQDGGPLVIHYLLVASYCYAYVWVGTLEWQHYFASQREASDVAQTHYG